MVKKVVEKRIQGRFMRQVYNNITNTIEKQYVSQKRFQLVGEKTDRADRSRTGFKETPYYQQMQGDNVARLWRRKMTG